MRTLFFILMCASYSSFGLDEKTVSKTFFTEAMPYFVQHTAQSMISNVDGKTIRYRYFPANQAKSLGTIVVVNGRTEFMAKYAEVLYDLRDSGFAFVVYDHRGQGESDRLLADPFKGFVSRYQDYVSDLQQLVEEVVKPLSPTGIYFLSHSMGGGVSTTYLIQNPGVVKAMVASSPMYQINAHKVPEWVVHALASAVSAVGFGDAYMPGSNGNSWVGPEDPAQNELTTSLSRYGYVKQLQLENPTWIISGPTYQWGREAIRMDRFVRENASQVKIPVLVMEGLGDTVVIPEVEATVESQFLCGTLLQLPGAKHEILIESQAIRDKALRSAVDFLKNKRL